MTINLHTKKSLGLLFFITAIGFVNSIIGLKSIYARGGSDFLGIIVFLTGFICILLFFLLLIDLLAKNFDKIQAEIVSIYMDSIYIKRDNGKVNSIRIQQEPELLASLKIGQQVELTKLRLTRLTINITIVEDSKVEMTLHKQFIKSSEHMRWANGEVMRTLQSFQGDLAKPLALFAHILAAEQIWLARIKGEDTSALSVWPDYSLEACEQHMAKNTEGYSDFLNKMSEADLNRIAEYQNGKGTTFSTLVSDILTHVFMHGSYHRAQIASFIKNGGATPVNTDYIQFVRLKDSVDEGKDGGSPNDPAAQSK